MGKAIGVIDWAVVGKVVAALGGGAALFLSGISIYSYFTAAKSELKASVEVNDFAMPPAVVAAAARDFNETAQQFLARDHAANGGDPTASGSGESTKTSQSAEGTKSGDLSSAFERFAAWAPADPAQLTQYVRIEVSNDGSLPAKGVSLTVPYQFQTVSVRKEDGTIVSYKAPKRLALGDINPREQVVVRAWSTLPRDLFDIRRIERGFALFYDGGLGAVSVEENRFNDPFKNLVLFFAAALGALSGLIALLTATVLKRGISLRITQGP